MKCTSMKKIACLLAAALMAAACSNEEPNIPPADPPRPIMNVQDSLAIVAFYHAMKCGEWKAPFHWDITDIDTWGGITVELDMARNEYRVTEIKVPNAEEYLPGDYYLPPELGNLTRLRSLIVYGDSRMVGEIPKELFDCPLENLYIMAQGYSSPLKGLYGSIPKEIGKVGETLKWLKISNTNIGGEIPEEIGKLQKLRTTAYLIYNEFTGKVPLVFRELPVSTCLMGNDYTEMEWRYFTENIGYFPDLHYNRLSGEIPEEVLTSERWEGGRANLTGQQRGYGYGDKYDKYFY